MAEGTHRQIEVKPGDTIILSSTPIPGNEEEVSRLINKLIARGAELIYPPLAAVHVSGHASQEELKLMLSLTRPKFFVPVHGELRHLHAHARLAAAARHPGREHRHGRGWRRAGADRAPAEGEEGDECRRATSTCTARAWATSAGGSLPSARSWATTALCLRSCPSIPRTGDVADKPELISRGFVFQKESSDLMERAAEAVYNALKEGKVRQRQAIIDRTQGILGRFFFEETKRKPMVLAVVTHCE